MILEGFKVHLGKKQNTHGVLKSKRRAVRGEHSHGESEIWECGIDRRDCKGHYLSSVFRKRYGSSYITSILSRYCKTRPCEAGGLTLKHLQMPLVLSAMRFKPEVAYNMPGWRWPLDAVTAWQNVTSLLVMSKTLGSVGLQEDIH